MIKKKKPVRIGIIRAEDFIIISITMFNKNKLIWIRRDVMEFDMFCMAIMIMINLLIASLTRKAEMQCYERITIVIIDIAMIVKYIKTRKEIIER